MHGAAMACKTRAGTSLGPGPMSTRDPGLMSRNSPASITTVAVLSVEPRFCPQSSRQLEQSTRGGVASARLLPLLTGQFRAWLHRHSPIPLVRIIHVFTAPTFGAERGDGLRNILYLFSASCGARPLVSAVSEDPRAHHEMLARTASGCNSLCGRRLRLGSILWPQHVAALRPQDRVFNCGPPDKNGPSEAFSILSGY